MTASSVPIILSLEIARMARPRFVNFAELGFLCQGVFDTPALLIHEPNLLIKAFRDKKKHLLNSGERR
jgi:hypothetical protein